MPTHCLQELFMIVDAVKAVKQLVAAPQGVGVVVVGVGVADVDHAPAEGRGAVPATSQLCQLSDHVGCCKPWLLCKMVAQNMLSTYEVK